MDGYSADAAKRRRLADVKKGTQYTKLVDSLASRQWHAHGGVPVGFLTRDQNMTPLHPQLTESSVDDSRTGSMVSVFPIITNHSTRVFPSELAIEDENMNYNTWGSRHYDFERKCVPEVRPEIVLPKQGVMMSRVLNTSQQRQFRTLTNFRSRNGTIRIIQPLNAKPPLPREQTNSELEQADLEREQTYVMLKRIDQILHPAKVYFKNDLSLSEIEVLSGDSLRDTISPVGIPKGILKNSRGKMREAIPKPSVRSTDEPHDPSLKQIVNRLAKSELDAYQKCQIWINKCGI